MWSNVSRRDIIVVLTDFLDTITMANSTRTLEQRVAAVEKQLAKLKNHGAPAKPDRRKHKPGWLNHIIDKHKDDPAFAEVIRLGREYRESLRPKRSK